MTYPHILESMTWQFFIHYLFSRRAGALIRSISRLCILGVGIGMVALVVVMSVMNGFNRDIKEKLLAAKPHLVVQGDINKYSMWLEELLQMKGVQAYQYHKQDVIIKTYDGAFGGAEAMGLTHQALGDFLKRIEQNNSKTKTANLHLGTNELTHNEIILGVGLAQELDIYEGDQIIIIPPEALLIPKGEMPLYEKAIVTSIIRTEVPEIDNKLIYYNIAGGFKHLSSQRSLESGLEVRVKDLSQVGNIKKILTSRGAQVQTWGERNKSLFYALKMEKIIIGIFIGLSAIITSFSIVTVLALLITQKRKDIGVLMALGMSISRVQKLFIKIGLLLAGCGLGGGLFVGVLLCTLLDNLSLELLPAALYNNTTIPVVIDYNLIIFAGLGGVFVAFLGVYWPTKMGLNITPSEALNSKK